MSQINAQHRSLPVINPDGDHDAPSPELTGTPWLALPPTSDNLGTSLVARTRD